MTERITNLLLPILQQETGRSINSLRCLSVGGGSINDTYQLIANDSTYFFLKTNKVSRYPGLFEKEKEGLLYLASQGRIATPRVIFCGGDGENQFLLLEYIAPGPRTERFWEKFGEQLASLHHCTQPQHGFSTDNYMGSLAQSNTLMRSWTEFFINQRILPQVELSVQKHLLSKTHVDLFQQLYKKLDEVFGPEPTSLLHGDLWSGNFLCNEKSEPVLIDPAVYYGHRSVDLGMTTLFGGFDRRFYQSYQYHFPFPGNHEDQWEICNLYPLLIHLNLFGQGYLGKILDTLKRYV